MIRVPKAKLQQGNQWDYYAVRISSVGIFRLAARTAPHHARGTTSFSDGWLQRGGRALPANFRSLAEGLKSYTDSEPSPVTIRDYWGPVRTIEDQDPPMSPLAVALNQYWVRAACAKNLPTQSKAT